MRTIACMAGCAVALAACGKPGETKSGGGPSAAAAAPTPIATVPARKSGLWEQTMTRDGKPGRMGKLRMCLDPATDAKMSLFGQSMGKSLCKSQSLSRGLDGSYSFRSTCDMGDGGSATSSGTLTGDFATRYKVHSESDITGARYAPMNGHHVTEIEAVWAGPCPAGMVAGDMEMGPGIKLNINKLSDAAAAMGGKAP
ncbi:MAG: DUF3617 family protein [Pseudomonadota bacterium]